MSSEGEKGSVVSSWSFREGVIFSILLVAAGFVVEAARGAQGVVLPPWPVNGIVLLVFSAYIVVVALVLRENSFFKWLGGIPLGLCLIIAIAVLSLFGGVLPQEEGAGPLWARTLRLNNVFSSWPFALTVFFFLFNLGLSLMWKTVPFRSSNLQFILFHAGFWIALACGLLGSADLQRVIIPLYEGRSTDRAYDAFSKAMIDLPFSIYLNDFRMEEYEPWLALYDPGKDQIEVDESGKRDGAAEGMMVSWQGVEVKVEKFFPFAVIDAGTGIPVPAETGRGVPYAFLSGKNDGKPFSGWVSTGSPFEKPAFVEVGDRLLILVNGSPKKFRSEVTIRSGEDGDGLSEALEVNKPVSIKGWKLYQMGYDEKSGRWSDLSLVEGVRDPWLPAVYLGFFMILAGNTLFFWKGIRKK